MCSGLSVFVGWIMHQNYGGILRMGWAWHYEEWIMTFGGSQIFFVNSGLLSEILYHCITLALEDSGQF